MDFESNEEWKAADGAADAAWNDSGLPVSSSSESGGSSLSTSSSKKLSTAIISSSNSTPLSHGGRQSKGGGSASTSGSRRSRSQSKGELPPVAVAVVDGEGQMGCVFTEAPPALILEIFSHLNARELSVVACVCSQFRRLAADSQGWKGFYLERWALPGPSAGGACSALPGKHWRELYMAKEARSKSMMGRFTIDLLHGHTATVRAVRLLPGANLICTGGLDQTVRLWNLEEGIIVAQSRPLGETVRAIAVDMSLLAVGGSDAVVRVWRAIPGCPYLFDVSGIYNQIPGSGSSSSRGAEIGLSGHIGPVSSLGLDSSNIYSGSWDMSIRVWNRSTLRCSRIFRHMDWVWALAVRGGRVLSTAGSDVYTWDAETGERLRVRQGVHAGQAYAVEGTRSGHILFTGGEDGVVRMFDDRISRRKFSAISDMTDDNAGAAAACNSGMKEAVASWTSHRSAVYSLAFDDPWLISASGDGFLAMMDVRQVMKRRTGPAGLKQQQQHSLAGGARGRRSGQDRYFRDGGGETAQRRLSAYHQTVYGVDIGADRIVSGGEERLVRIWDFSQALEVERRVQAARSSQITSRTRKKQLQRAAAGGTDDGLVDAKRRVAVEAASHAEIDEYPPTDEEDVDSDSDWKSGTTAGGGHGIGLGPPSTRRGRQGPGFSNSRRQKGPKDANEFARRERGARGHSPIHGGPGQEFGTRARYVDSVSVSVPS